MSNDPCWMVNPKAGVMSVMSLDVDRRLKEGWIKCDDSGQPPKPEVPGQPSKLEAPKMKKKKDAI